MIPDMPTTGNCVCGIVVDLQVICNDPVNHFTSGNGKVMLKCILTDVITILLLDIITSICNSLVMNTLMHQFVLL